MFRRISAACKPSSRIARGLKQQQPLSKIIDELREKLKEASPEIKAKIEAEIDKRQVWFDKLQADDEAGPKDSLLDKPPGDDEAKSKQWGRRGINSSDQDQ